MQYRLRKVKCSKSDIGDRCQRCISRNLPCSNVIRAAPSPPASSEGHLRGETFQIWLAVQTDLDTDRSFSTRCQDLKTSFVKKNLS
jgi:hypothetical protein